MRPTDSFVPQLQLCAVHTAAQLTALLGQEAARARLLLRPEVAVALRTASPQAGVSARVIRAHEAFCDSVSIEDTIVVWHDRAPITRMTEHREVEQSAIITALRPTQLLWELSSDARLAQTRSSPPRRGRTAARTA